MVAGASLVIEGRWARSLSQVERSALPDGVVCVTWAGGGYANDACCGRNASAGKCTSFDVHSGINADAEQCSAAGCATKLISVASSILQLPELFPARVLPRSTSTRMHTHETINTSP